MNEIRTRVATGELMRALGGRLAGVLRPGDLVLLSGELGAGKTTLTQGLAEGLGVRGPVTSPTFVIARVHPSLRGGPDLVHVDAYRLHSLDEVDDLDLDAALEESVTVVEWGQGKVEGLSESRLEVELRRRTGHQAPADVDADTDTDTVSDEPSEERDVVVRGVGERWADVDLARLA
ncbi:MAG TPA: tRNA (adenosine(37)-N6)-threonylcarbamoyltransferase complex ATPase subunit type 1 TsaE [Motilibacteraceae bacterium]|nr:tRNA (adenosine(37)-N6)-threonylcarbamoyltransferase complex ATPase subunit type 1 TsaE [Motilibacteraceae bacterium]